MSKERFPGFDACVRMMRKRSASVQEEGFHHLLPHAHQFVSQLMAEFKAESTHGLKCWLLELIGEAKQPETFSFLVEQFRSEDPDFQMWARCGLRNLNTKESRKFLFEAGISR